MTEQEISIALAEVYGWTDIYSVDEKYKTTLQLFVGTDPQGRKRSVPDYWHDAYTFEDLWHLLTEEKRGQFVDVLCEIVKEEDHPIRYMGPGTLISVAFFATAQQRCKAILKVFNKWKD